MHSLFSSTHVSRCNEGHLQPCSNTSLAPTSLSLGQCGPVRRLRNHVLAASCGPAPHQHPAVLRSGPLWVFQSGLFTSQGPARIRRSLLLALPQVLRYAQVSDTCLRHEEGLQVTKDSGRLSDTLGVAVAWSQGQAPRAALSCPFWKLQRHPQAPPPVTRQGFEGQMKIIASGKSMGIHPKDVEDGS